MINLTGTVLAVHSVFAAIAPADLWMAADFDLPTEIDGKAVYPKIDSRNLVEGRWGKAFYCHREAVNALAKGYYAAPTNLPAGSFTFPAQPDPMKYSWIKPSGGLTWSCFVKGAKGTKVVLTPSLTPVTEQAVKDAKKKKERKYTDENAVKDSVTASTNVLDGTWQRVWCGIVHDCRTTDGRLTALTVDASAPVQIKCLMLEASAKYPYWALGPSKYVEGGDARTQRAVMIRDPEVVRDFPVAEGSASFWVRSFKDEWTWEGWNGQRVWCYESPSCTISFDGELRLGRFSSMMRPKWGERFARSEKWQHVVNVWRKDGESEIWIDGTLRAKSAKNALSVAPSAKREIRLGTATNGEQPGDVAIDDFAIFRRALTAAEIRELAAGAKPLRAGAKLFAGPVHFPVFRRHQTDAAIRFTVDAPRAGEWRVDATVGGTAQKRLTPVKLAEGINHLAVPFDPSDFRVGSYGWSVKLVNAAGETGLEKAGELEIRPRRDPKAPMYMSWGGGRPVTPEFMNESGLDAANVQAEDLPQVRRLLAAGIRPNVRFENSGWWETDGFGKAKLKARVEAVLKPFEGLCDWNTTLVNSEVYGTWVADKLKNRPDWLALAEKAIGMKPDFTFGHAPSQVLWKQLGREAPRGIIGHDVPALETLEWTITRGQPVYAINRVDRDVIHAMDPDNVVWTEPYYGGWIATDVDMMADWLYDYSTDVILLALRGAAANSRYFHKAFMPTLSMYNGAPGRHPVRKNADGTPEKVTMGQSLDELVTKTWMCIAAGRADNLSMFSANSWQDGVKEYAVWKTNANAKVSVIADPDAPAKYREIVKRRVMPALELMRGLDNVRAKVAVIHTSEADTAGGFGWAHWHYNRAIVDAMAKSGVPYDVVNGAELKEGKALPHYKYAIWPMNCVTREEHDRAAREAAAKGTVIVQDGFGRQEYPNGLRIASTNFWNPKKLPVTAGGPVLDFLTNRVEELSALAPSISGGDFRRESFTFEKRLDGVRYVTVVNNRRRGRDEGGGVLTTFCTNDWYRPYGASAKISTELRGAGAGAAVYEFNGAGLLAAKGGRVRTVTTDYGPGEGRVYCVYPEPLGAPGVEYRRTAANRGELVVSIDAKSGRPAPARTVVELTLTDPEGRVADESGRYVVERGRLAISVHFAAVDAEGGLFSKWKAVVRDLTTGESGSCGFTK